MSQTFVVVAETRGGKLRQVSLETAAAASLSAQPDDRIAAVLLGSGVSAFAGELAAAGVSTVYVVDHPALEAYRPDAYLAALRKVFEHVPPDAVYLGHTAIGRDLAPAVAAALDAGQISDVTAIERKGDRVVFTRPLYAGKAFEKKTFERGPWVVTVRPNNIKAIEADGSPCETVTVDYPAPSLRSVVKDVVKKMSGKIDLAEAKIIVSGGRGVKSADGFKPLEALAAVLGGAVGASRGACDAGYCDYALQIGQTGKVVTPELYIACGISGAIQHLAGMSSSRVIVAINKDPEAPIFKVADYGIVGDLFEVVPLLTEEFRKLL
ncbi:electron transfer flavoprotein subunit alpha [Gordoniibacillus kamchatkensis]|uniref:Electron transfer flavoprotein subunit alpha n=1 Tax=Gordoniibacillus kamchatkensis TaxID=1590651 RepID=A0ABR5AHG8_9BACL|nr:electron transfer flavoprotein subunit alpha/FixB family protein [Paenibacillus sp. VKM B-2647]KIL40188.1 electron transfer flavoprotein subunit alpha [Paenibacillus sp. VKM B-2647]